MLSFNAHGFSLTVTVGIADENKGKRRWTQVQASLLGYPCATLEGLATIKAWLEAFKRDQIKKKPSEPILGDDENGVTAGGRQRQGERHLYLCRRLGSQDRDEIYLDYIRAATLEVAVNKAIQKLAPQIGWGKET
ncbi:MAG TPA: hypothetical protein DDZ34_04810 [Syntrophaceae bacterium]|nr:hypothetical protein [Syntrophaceae bacterium]